MAISFCTSPARYHTPKSREQRYREILEDCKKTNLKTKQGGMRNVKDSGRIEVAMNEKEGGTR